MKRKTRIIIIGTLIVMGCFTSWLQYQPVTEILLEDVEALTKESGSGEIINCYCALMSDQSCAVNNNGSSKCVSGVKAKCWEYNNNCN